MATAVDKKEYQSIIATCTGILSLSQFHSRLNKLLVSSEDMHLKKLLTPVVQHLAGAHRDMKARKKANEKFPIHVEQEPYKSLLRYCQSCIVSVKPKWQIIAENHGWKPPQNADRQSIPADVLAVASCRQDRG